MAAENGASILPIRQFGKSVAPSQKRGLLDLRLSGFRDFLTHGIAQSLVEIRADAPWNLTVRLHSPELSAPERSSSECVAEGLTYDAPLNALATQTDASGEVVAQRILLCRLPLMDASGGFIISGVRRRTVIHQIARAPGVWFDYDHDQMSGKRLGRGFFPGTPSQPIRPAPATNRGDRAAGTTLSAAPRPSRMAVARSASRS